MKKHYQATWREYRILIWFAYLCIPVMFLFLFANEKLGTLIHPAILMVGALAAMVFVGIRMILWACPRCGSKSTGLFGSPPWNKACRQCGLRKYEVPSEIE